MPKIQSLRLRIALLSALLSGLVLSAFGAMSWIILWRANVASLDSELRSQVFQELVGIHPKEHWRNYQQQLQQTLSKTGTFKVILWAGTPTNDIIYQSETWPANITPPQLSFPNVSPQPRNPPLIPETPNFPLPPQPGINGLPPPDRNFPNRPPAGYPERPAQQPAGLPPLPEMQRQQITLLTRRSNGQRWRLALGSNAQLKLAVGASLSGVEVQMRPVRNAFLAAFPVAFLWVAGSAWLVASRALRPIQRLTQTVQGVTVQDLNLRLNTQGEDVEIKSLILVFNQMMERLERSFHQAQRFSADAAHELKTPLTILQGEIEQALQSCEDSGMQETLVNLLEETQRLKTIVRKLLLLSLADAGKLPIQSAPFNLSLAVEESIDDAQMLAPHLKIKAEIPPNLQIIGDSILLRQVLQNLISNAIKYNLPKGYIHCKLGMNHQQVWFSILNPSERLSPQAKQQLFNRFYRVDSSRNRKIEGLGLGLSLCREIARAHQGDIVLEKSIAGTVCFKLILPKVRKA